MLSVKATAPDSPIYCAGIVIPAHNEAGCIGACMKAILNSAPLPGPLKIVVAANGCTDNTVTIARQFLQETKARGWCLEVIDSVRPGKLQALNLGEKALDTPITIYLDADVIVSRTLLADLITELDRPEPRYASGEPKIMADGSPVTRAYARFWRSLPFVGTDVPGFGIFGVNRAGRARWDTFPDIISDDMFVRLNFAPGERVRVGSTYEWPLVRRLRDLVRVRRRQDAGNQEIAEFYPSLCANEAVRRPNWRDLVRRLFRDPAGFTAYALVILLTRLPARPGTPRWARGR